MKAKYAMNLIKKAGRLKGMNETQAIDHASVQLGIGDDSPGGKSDDSPGTSPRSKPQVQALGLADDSPGPSPRRQSRAAATRRQSQHRGIVKEQPEASGMQVEGSAGKHSKEKTKAAVVQLNIGLADAPP